MRLPYLIMWQCRAGPPLLLPVGPRPGFSIFGCQAVTGPNLRSPANAGEVLFLTFSHQLRPNTHLKLQGTSPQSLTKRLIRARLIDSTVTHTIHTSQFDILANCPLSSKAVRNTLRSQQVRRNRSFSHVRDLAITKSRVVVL